VWRSSQRDEDEMQDFVRKLHWATMVPDEAIDGNRTQLFLCVCARARGS